MDYILYVIESLMNILKNERKMFTDYLSDCPAGGLILGRQANRQFFMHSVPVRKGGENRRRYRKTKLREDDPMVRQLAGKEYARIAVNMYDHNIHVLEVAKAGLKGVSFDVIRNMMRRPYQGLPDESIRAAIDMLNCDERLRLWAQQPYEQSDYRPEEKIHTTSRGLKVRSRADLLIAEMLYMLEVPFRYEQVIHAGHYELAPDFTFLDADGNEFFWEYCGRMGDPKYVRQQIWRRGMYESIGITEWKNMIYTYDDADGIDMREIQFIIRNKILPRMRPEAA